MMARAGSAADEAWLGTPGDHEVATSTVCVLTRFGLSGPRHLLPTYRDYRRVVRQALESETPGLLKSAFLVESPTSCYGLSIWADYESIPWFGTNVPVHVEAGNSVFRRLSHDPARGAELWSTKWQLVGVSRIWEMSR
jgi:hypothetical protein